MTLMFINVHAIACSLMTLYVNKSCALNNLKQDASIMQKG